MNTFGPTPSQQFPLIDPRSVRENRRRFRREMLPILERANSFYMPTGRWPCRGFILIDRNSYNQINPYFTNFLLNIGNTKDPNNVKTLQNISIVQAQCVTRGLATDPNAVYLIELTDDEGVLYNEWFQTPLTTAYNIRVPAYPQTFHPWSMNGGTTWTWSTMLQDIWNKMSTTLLLGTWPGLPFVPTGTPEGFWFSGVPAWPAFVDILEHLGMTMTVDMTVGGNPYSIVQAGVADAAFSALQAKYAGRLEDDLEWEDFGSGRVPGSVTVAFRRRNDVFGTEETVRYDSPFQWESNPYYTVVVPAPALFAGGAGSHLLFSDFTVRYDQDGSPLAADVVMANAIAQERTSQYYAKAYRGTAGYMTQTYVGALPFKTGSLVDGVCWYQNYQHDDGYGGWRTQIVRGPFPPWESLWDAVGMTL